MRHLILIGEAKEKIRKALQDTISIEEAPTMREAVNLAATSARRGETILLSPACTSFDMFRDFEHRGRVFKQEVRRLIRQRSGGSRK